ELKIKQIIPRTHNIKSFQFRVKGRVDFKPGQFLQASIMVRDKQENRYLSVSNSPTERDLIEFTKKITDSEFSQALDKMKPGDHAKIKYPYGVFTFEGEHKKIAFLSGGIGITPIRSIIKYIVDKKLDTDIVLIYANRTIKDIAFKDEFEQMQRAHHKLRVVHILTQPEAGWQGKTGRIDAKIIRQEIPDYAQRKFYICGPPAMVEAMKRIIQGELGLPKESIITENFAGY
ncbi:MAG: FAD-binding oxidoreductase, partial [Candidatus Omnitrophota bacterium]